MLLVKSSWVMTHVDAYLLDGSTFVSGAKLQSPNVKGNVIISLLAMLLIICAYSNCNMCIPWYFFMDENPTIQFFESKSKQLNKKFFSRIMKLILHFLLSNLVALLYKSHNQVFYKITIFNKYLLDNANNFIPSWVHFLNEKTYQ